jgi:predicted nucleic acid-binding protein
MIVIDTNVFISQLFQVEKMLKDLSKNLVLYVPWAVLNELDSLSKSERQIRLKAVKATQFLHKHLLEKNPLVREISDCRLFGLHFNLFIRLLSRVILCIPKI